MVDKSDLEPVKTTLEKIKKGTDFLKKYSETGQELMKAGKELKTFMKIATELEGLDKLSAGLAAAGFAIEVAQMFMGGKSENEQILDGIKDLKHELTGMWTDISKRMKAFDAEFKEAVTELKLYPGMIALQSLKDDFETYVILGDDVNLTQGDNNTETIKKYFQALGDNLGKFDKDKNALLLAYESNHGSVPVMRGLVSNYLNIAVMMPTAYALVNRLAYEQGLVKELISAEEMSRDLETARANIFAGCQHILEKLAHEEDSNINQWLMNMDNALSHPKMTDRFGKVSPVDANSADPNPGRNYFHIPAQDVLDALVKNWPGVSFWVIIGQKYLNDNWTVANPAGLFGVNNFYSLINPDEGGDYAVTVFWTRKPANPHGEEQVRWLFGNSLTEWEESEMAVDTNGNNNATMHNKYSTYKGYVYQKGLARAVDEWPEETSFMSGGTGARKDRAWALRSNAYDRVALWLYPSWNPLDEGVKTSNSQAFVHVTKSGNTGVAYTLIW